jgi:hypothetical protein
MLVPSTTQINRIIDEKGSTGPIRTKFQKSKEKENKAFELIFWGLCFLHLDDFNFHVGFFHD